MAVAAAQTSSLSAGKVTILLVILLCSGHRSLGVSNNNTLTQGGPAVTPSLSLVSPNGLFGLGFSLISQGTYLGIWYKNDTRNSFWIANRDSPIRDGSGAALSLDRNGTLKLTSSGGSAVQLFSSSSSNSSRRLVAVLEDTGNFAVRDEASGELLWQSFDYPADSWLPGMKLGVVNGQSRKLTSWLTYAVPPPGAFELEWGGGELVVKRRGVVFWTSGKQLAPDAFKNLALVDGMSLDLNLTRTRISEEDDYLTFTASTRENSNRNERNFTILRLTFDGGIEDHSSPRSVLPNDRCDGNSTADGCARWAGPECRRRDGGDWYVVIPIVISKRATVRVDNNASLALSDCRDMCWRECQCGAFTEVNSTSQNGTGCVFIYGKIPTQRFALEAQLYGVIANKAFFATASDAAPASTVSRKNWIVWGSVAAAGALLWMILAICIRRRRRRLIRGRFLAELVASDAPNDMDEMEEEEDDDPGHQLKVYTIASIITATDNFSIQNKLGQGGFGPVYKGKLSEGRDIAVKRLSKRSGQGLVEFKNELILIAKLQHTNLVRLLGCCINEEEKMLVYEYMPNKSLDSFIFDTSKRSLLNWNKRFNIIEGIAQGLLYLHKYSRVRIIHRDLKAGNILLDGNLHPKISDFGMARMFKTNASEGNTNRVVGTYGYMSPEYAVDGIFSTKSDVFSYGILLLEIVSGKKNQGLMQLDPSTNLVGCAWELWKEGTPLELIEPTLRDSCTSNGQILRCINVALLCIEYNASDRPEMSEVLSMLTSESVQLPSPKQPAFTMARMRCSNSEESSSPNNPEVYSTNGVTITMMTAR